MAGPKKTNIPASFTSKVNHQILPGIAGNAKLNAITEWNSSILDLENTIDENFERLTLSFENDIIDNQIIALGQYIDFTNITHRCTTSYDVGGPKSFVAGNFQVIGTPDGGGPAIENRFSNITDLTSTASQSLQTDKGLQFVLDASADPDISTGYAYYEYLGTTNEDLTDYRLQAFLLAAGEGTTITGENIVNVGGTASEFVQIQIAIDKGFSFHTNDAADQHNLLLHPALMELKYRNLSETLFTILRSKLNSVPTRNIGGQYLMTTNGSDLETDGTKAAGIALLKDGTIDVGELHPDTGRFSHMGYKHDYSTQWDLLDPATKDRVIPDIEWILANAGGSEYLALGTFVPLMPFTTNGDYDPFTLIADITLNATGIVVGKTRALQVTQSPAQSFKIDLGSNILGVVGVDPLDAGEFTLLPGTYIFWMASSKVTGTLGIHLNVPEGEEVVQTPPTLINLTMAADNSYCDLLCSEAVWGNIGATDPVLLADLAGLFAANGGTATDWIESSVKQNDSPIEGSASPLVGGEGGAGNPLRIFGAPSGTADGQETITFGPTGGTSIFDGAGNPMPAGETATDNLEVGAPNILSQTVENAAKNDLVVVFDENVTATNIGYTLRVNTTPRTLSAVSGSGTNTLTFTISGAELFGDDVLDLSYSQGTGDTIGVTTGGELLAFSQNVVANNVLGFSEAIQSDTSAGDLHFSVLERKLWTLDVSDITTTTSISPADVDLTGGITGNKPSLDAGNNQIVFDVSNTEALTNSGTFAGAINGDDTPFSFAMVVKLNSIPAFQSIFSFGSSAANKPFIDHGILSDTPNLFRFRKRDEEIVANTADAVYQNAEVDTNLKIITAFCTGTAITIYFDGVKIIDAVAFDVDPVTLFDQFALSGLWRDTFVNTADMNIKEFAFLKSNVGDARVQAWNTSLNDLYSVF